MRQSAQVLTRHELHGDELHAIGFRQVVDTNYISVGHLARQDELLLEALDDGGVTCQIRTNHLERYQLIHFPVSGLVNGAHAALPEEFQNFIPLAKDALRLQDGSAVERACRSFPERSRAPIRPRRIGIFA